MWRAHPAVAVLLWLRGPCLGLLSPPHYLQGKFINDPQVLLEAAQQAGVEGAEEYLKSDAGRSEVQCSCHDALHLVGFMCLSGS